MVLLTTLHFSSLLSCTLKGEEKETQIFMGKEVESNMKMLLSDREEFWRICESLSDDSKKSISELVKASEKDEKLMEVAEKAGWTKVRVVI